MFMDFLDLAAKRYSVRSFSARKVEPELIAKILRAGQFKKVADGGADDIVFAFEKIVMLREATQRTCYVGSDGRFFGNDQLLAHE